MSRKLRSVLNVMEKGCLPGAYSWIAGESLWRIGIGKRIFGYCCKNCGYVEFYLEKKFKSER